jgi:hypothetical protein
MPVRRGSLSILVLFGPCLLLANAQPPPSPSTANQRGGEAASQPIAKAASTPAAKASAPPGALAPAASVPASGVLWKKANREGGKP